MADQPNVLLVMADQMTATLTGAYGHPVVKTPAMDRLCAQGVRFDAAYTNCPLCTPARAAMLSGRYVSRTRSYDNAGSLCCDVPTFAHHLRLAGYEVVASGKLHQVGADQLHGFERRLTTDIYPSDYSWIPDWQKVKQGKIRSKAVAIPRSGPCDWSTQMTYDEEVHFRALEFLRLHRPDAKRDDTRPFCLMVSYTHPHPPYLAPRKYWDLYENAEIDVPGLSEACVSEMDRWLYRFEGVPPEMLQDEEMMRRCRRAYYGMVSYVDHKLAELVQTLEQLGLRDDTAIVVTSDHGDMLGERQLVEKRVLYEGSARIPLIASFPGHWAQGHACAAPVSLIDLFPTLVDTVDAPPPLNIDGQSFRDLLVDPASPADTRLAISEYHSEGVKAPCFMVRKAKYKYIYVHGFDAMLFDLETDPRELNNLAGQPEVAQIEASLRSEIMNRFDPDSIAADVDKAQKERLLLRDAMRAGRRTHWDFQPFFDATQNWSRG